MINFGPLAKNFYAFWATSILSFAVGVGISLHLDVFQGTAALRDGLAYFFVFVVGFAFLNSELIYQSSELCLKLLGIISAVCISLMFLLGNLPISSFEEYFWYVNKYRFAGFSVNPNQFALFCVSVPFLSFYCFTKDFFNQSYFLRASCLLLISMTIVAGYYTKSLAIVVTWAISFSTLLALLAADSARRDEFNKAKIKLILSVITLSFFIILVTEFSTLFLPSLGEGISVADAEKFRKVEMVAFGQRVDLLVNGLKALEMSPAFGLGPGPYSGLSGPFEGSEAHNSILDWSISTGAIGFISLLLLSGWAAFQILRNKHYEIFVAVGSIFIFGQMHHVLRHPFVWCVLILGLLIVEKERNTG